jgi:hypothetical protein
MITNEANELSEAAGENGTADQLATFLAGELARQASRLLRRPESKPGQNLPILRELVHQVTQLRRGDHRAQWVDLKVTNHQSEQMDRITETLELMKPLDDSLHQWIKEYPNFMDAEFPDLEADKFATRFQSDKMSNVKNVVVICSVRRWAKKKMTDAIEKARKAKGAPPPADPAKSPERVWRWAQEKLQGQLQEQKRADELRFPSRPKGDANSAESSLVQVDPAKQSSPVQPNQGPESPSSPAQSSLVKPGQG